MAGKNVLLVEGKDDEHVVKHLCGNHGLPDIDEIADLGGIEPLLESFSVRLKESDINALGVLVDADTDIQTRWDALRDHLIKAQYPSVPGFPLAQGTALPPPNGTLLPRVGIWLMPDNQTNGSLEDFLKFLVPQPNPLFDHAEKSIDTIPPEDLRFTEKNSSKALIHTWLAWQKEPGRPYGTAITARFLDPDVSQVNIFITWLKDLFF